MTNKNEILNVSERCLLLILKEAKLNSSQTEQDTISRRR